MFDFSILFPAGLNGLTTCAVYALVALGLTLIYGVLHIINFAHGAALMMALLVTAVLIAISRILLGMHFLTDVVAGSIIGITLGRLSFHFFRFHFFHLL